MPNNVAEASINVPSPEIEIVESTKRPMIFPDEERVTTLIFAVIPLVIARKIAGPGLIM